MKSVKHSFLPLLLFASIFLFSACLGYHFQGSGGALPEHLKTVAITPFANQTYESLVDTYLTNALVGEFSRSKRLRMVDQADADLVISGAVKEVSNTSISYSGNDRAYEYRVRVRIEVVIRDVRQDIVVWQNGNMHEVEEYHTSGEPNDVQTRKRVAIARVCKVLAENIHDRLFIDF
ncbi:MAG: LptE family protein [Deltaproteobacteria bacterium]|nr:LptE family protein [Candidatus Anaeroferrophillus wilburensis]MBN2890108.1 LptE family protein [Deltaproteobacteria bacterium]